MTKSAFDYRKIHSVFVVRETQTRANLHSRKLIAFDSTNAADGSYAAAMASVEAMREFIDHLDSQSDRAANMDW